MKDIKNDVKNKAGKGIKGVGVPFYKSMCRERLC